MKDLIKQFLKDLSIYSLQPIVVKLIGFLLIPLYTKYLTPADFGNLQFILTFGAFFSTIIEMKLSSSYWKFKADNYSHTPQQVALNLLLTQLYLGLVFLIVSVLIYLMFFNQNILGIFIILCFISETFGIVYNASLLFHRAKHRAKHYLIATIVQSLLLIASNIVLIIYFKLNYAGVIISYVIAFFISSILQLKYIFQECKGTYSIDLSKQMIKYGYPLMIGNIAMIIISLSDRYFLKILSNDEQLGLYSYGYKFADLIKILLINPFMLAWNPIRWKIYEMPNRIEIFSQFYRYILILLPALALFIGGIIVIIADFATINNKFLEGFQIYAIIIYANVFYGLYFFNFMGLLFENKTNWVMKIIFFIALLNVLLNFMLIPSYGMLGAAIATIICYFLLFIISGFYSQKVFPIQKNKIFEILQVIISLLCLFLLYFAFQFISNVMFYGIFMFLMAAFYLTGNILTKQISLKKIFTELSAFKKHAK